MKLANGLVTGLAICFPFYLWFVGWEHTVMTAIYLISAGSLKFIATLSSVRSGVDWLTILVPIALGLLVLTLGPRSGLYYPVVINLGLLLIFYTSLSTPKNIILRIAEKTDKQALDSTYVRYTVYLTKIWCAVFIFNTLIAAILAWYQLLALWTVYNGFVAYLIIGLLLFGERLSRRRILLWMSRSDNPVGN